MWRNAARKFHLLLPGATTKQIAAGEPAASNYLFIMITYFSKYNIFSRIRNSENYFILNALSGNADILNPDKAKEIIEEKYTDIDEYVEKGYLANSDEEKKKYKSEYEKFIKKRDSSEIQIFYVPGYDCNFNCSYCYQDEYQNDKPEGNGEVINAFFNYLSDNFSNRKMYITIFGGEPLLNTASARESMKLLLEGAARAGLQVAVVTNGYHLNDYIDIIKSSDIREIQVTLDGTEEVHNSRRSLAGGGATFQKIVEGIDRALVGGIPINLRVVLDRENISDLPNLSDFAIEKGWTSNPLFKTQFGRNYELHHCFINRNILYDRVELYKDIYKLLDEYPQILQFHRPAFSISRFLKENGEMPDPLFDSCPGCKTEWAFDYAGKIYPCTATVGKAGESVGSFYPVREKEPGIIDTWYKRDVTTINECGECSLQLLCGGGCAVVARNNTGRISAPDCRPVKELMEMGLSYYFEKETRNVR